MYLKRRGLDSENRAWTTDAESRRGSESSDNQRRCWRHVRLWLHDRRLPSWRRTSGSLQVLNLCKHSVLVLVVLLTFFIQVELMTFIEMELENLETLWKHKNLKDHLDASFYENISGLISLNENSSEEDEERMRRWDIQGLVGFSICGFYFWHKEDSSKIVGLCLE